MKFELFDNYNDYYQEIDCNDYYELDRFTDKINSFTLKEIDAIMTSTNIISNMGVYRINDLRASVSISQSRISIVLYNGIIVYQFIKLKDEYYLVFFDKDAFPIHKSSYIKHPTKRKRYYKCDQLDGLLKCMEILK